MRNRCFASCNAGVRTLYHPLRGPVQVAYLLQGNNLNPFDGSKITTFADALRNALVRCRLYERPSS